MPDVVPPLAGIRVLDLSQALSGPYATMMLADAGADVIKVEPPDGDHVRSWLQGSVPVSPYLLAANRSKRSLVVDLKHKAGREIVLALAQHSDVVVENFKPGVVARLGIAYDDVRQINPRAVYCSISGFGQLGPFSHKVAYDLIASGYGGTMSVTGEPDGRYVRPGVPTADLIAATVAAYSILLSLMQRERSGQGFYLDLALLDGQVFAMAHHLLAFQATGALPGLHGSAHPQVAPYQTYRTGTTDINIAVLTDKQWRAFCSVLGHLEWLADPRYLSPGTRNAHRRVLEREIEAVLVTRCAKDWLEALENVGVPCGPINTTADLLDVEQLRQRGMYLEYDDPDIGRIRVPGAPWRGPGVLEQWTPPPRLGEHTEDVLREVLGLSSYRLEELRSEGVIAARSAELVTRGAEA
jgi:crotonobetainyl-CoA:carnitine CoA-transferase CaiB-like acyl-CoA transferase